MSENQHKSNDSNQNIQNLALKLSEKLSKHESISETKELEDLLNLIYPKLRNYIRKYNTDNYDVEEVLHQSLYKIYKNFNTYDSTYRFTTWIYNIARNVSMAYQNRVKSNFMDIEDDATKSHVSQEKLQTKNEFEKTMETEKEVNDLYGVVIEEILNLKDSPEKDAFIDSFINNMTNQAIAEKYDIKLNTIKTRIRRARRILKSNIYQKYPDIQNRIKEILS